MTDELFPYKLECPICGETDACVSTGEASNNFYATHYYKHMLEVESHKQSAKKAGIQ